MSSSPTSTARSLYRRFLRELPASATAASSKSSLLSTPSPVQRRIRSFFAAPLEDGSLTSVRLQEAEQFAQYVQAQRMYATLVERYNPGMNMTEEDRVRLTARRVGMDLPVEHVTGSKKP